MTIPDPSQQPDSPASATSSWLERLLKSGYWGILIGLLGGLLATGVILLVSSPPRGKPVELLPPPTAEFLTVHVIGEVVSPGVYQLAPGSHRLEAVQAAGGATQQADLQAINLAALLEDGEQIQVPALPGAAPEVPPVRSAPVLPSTAPTPAAPQSGLIDINTATQAELESLPGIGPVTAEKIIAYRAANGPFQDIEAIQDVPGIGPGLFEKIKNLITVNSTP
jgi:competence protein ComEA